VVGWIKNLGFELNAGIYKNQSLLGNGDLDTEGWFLGEGGNIFKNWQRLSFGIESGWWLERWKDILLSAQYVTNISRSLGKNGPTSRLSRMPNAAIFAPVFARKGGV
jgi:hypothetical protein